MSPSKKVSLRRTPYPSEDDLRPFINAHEQITNRPVDESTHAPLAELSSRVASNAETLKLSKVYRKELPELLKDKIELMREFFLKEITPYLLAATSALQDADEVLQYTFEEKADTEKLFARIENSLHSALDIRIINFIHKFVGLTAEESRQLMLVLLSKEVKHDSLARQLIELLPEFGDTDKPAKKVAKKTAERKPAAKKTTKASKARKTK